MVIAAIGLARDDDDGQGPDRPRPPAASEAVPPYESSPSFPSGHTLNATVLTAILVYLVLRRLDAAWARATASWSAPSSS